MSQTELGKLVNVSQQTVTAWENNKAEPTSGAVTRLAEIFNISTDYLLGVKSGTASADKENTLTENQKLIAYSIDPDITDEEREDIMQLVKIAMKNRRRI
ncbi:helix-turn-helix domain-containing protein [Limosilactobacillus equigenerosi]|uniref:HTH cro/C1-type domain-containing protein n=2 Tax=Limosilactobacillus TaxID=2742598 RepID=A0A0R1UG12_9LACO|nr:hypothetical protein FC21_GL000361 [Limosilactobacillus equigenerosi DSM 18793 = JCM 14505]